MIKAVKLINENNEILLQKRSKFKKVNPGKWGICGGKVEIGETTQLNIAMTSDYVNAYDFRVSEK